MDVRSMRGVVGAATVLLLVPGTARATIAPRITVAPAIDGVAQVGAELAASATWTGDPQPTAAWAWLRCAKPTSACTVIDGAATDRYLVAEADLGLVFRARLKVTNSAGSADARSKPTAVIAAAPIATPTPTPEPTPAPDPAPAVLDSVPAPVSLPAVASPPPAAPKPMQPFPVVRIKGLLIATGARVTLLSVRAPRTARIEVTCQGDDCPVRRLRAPAGTKRLRRFERDLRAGTRLEVRVTSAGHIGKYTEFVIRRRAEPRRVDRCLDPRKAAPVRCVSE